MSAASAAAYRLRQKQKLARLAQLEVADEMNRGLLRNQSEKIACLEEEIEGAKAIAGELSILFPATTMAVECKARDTWDMPVLEWMATCIPDDSMLFNQTLEAKRLTVMLGSIDHRQLARQVHFMLRFGDKRLGYAMSSDDMRALPRRVAIRRISESLAKAFLQEGAC